MSEEKFDLSDKEDLDKIKEKLESEPKTESLHINRVPAHTKQDFQDLANEYFAGDYGWLLMYLMNREELRDYVDNRVNEIKKRVAYLETIVGNDEEDENQIKRLNEEE